MKLIIFINIIIKLCDTQILNHSSFPYIIALIIDDFKFILLKTIYSSILMSYFLLLLGIQNINLIR